VVQSSSNRRACAAQKIGGLMGTSDSPSESGKEARLKLSRVLVPLSARGFDATITDGHQGFSQKFSRVPTVQPTGK
jgi:hypothetical protein